MGGAISKILKPVPTQTVESGIVMNPLRKQDGTQFIQEIVSTEAMMNPLSEAGTSMVGDGMAKEFDKSFCYINIVGVMLGCAAAVNGGLNLVSLLLPTSPHDLTAEDIGKMGNSFFVGSFFVGSVILGSAVAIKSLSNVYQYIRSPYTPMG